VVVVLQPEHVVVLVLGAVLGEELLVAVVVAVAVEEEEEAAVVVVEEVVEAVEVVVADLMCPCDINDYLTPGLNLSLLWLCFLDMLVCFASSAIECVIPDWYEIYLFFYNLQPLTGRDTSAKDGHLDQHSKAYRNGIDFLDIRWSYAYKWRERSILSEGIVVSEGK